MREVSPGRPVSRRRLLALAGTAAAGGLAGCSQSADRPPANPKRRRPTGRTDRSATSRTSPGTPGRTDDETRLTVTGVDVSGSESGRLRLNPPGTVSLVEFFATWCPPCRAVMDVLREVRARFDRDRVTFVSVTATDLPEVVEAFWEKHDATWRVGIDPDMETFQAYDVTGFPTIVVLFPDGTVDARLTSEPSVMQLTTVLEDALDWLET